MLPDAPTAGPDLYHVVLENTGYACEVRGNPGDQAPLHSHPAQVAIALTDAEYRFISASGEAMDVVLQSGMAMFVVLQSGMAMFLDLQSGMAMFLDPVEHSTELTGSADSRTLLVELK